MSGICLQSKHGGANRREDVIEQLNVKTKGSFSVRKNKQDGNTPFKTNNVNFRKRHKAGWDIPEIAQTCPHKGLVEIGDLVQFWAAGQFVQYRDVT